MIINEIEYRQLVNKIQKGTATFLQRESNRVTMWSIDYRDRKLLAVYDTSRQTIITFLPTKEK
jgi:hypothetical protein